MGRCRKIEIKFSKDIEYLKDMVLFVKDLVPLEKLAEIKTRQQDKKKYSRSYAMIYQYKKGNRNTYTIYLRPKIFEIKRVRPNLFTQTKLTRRHYGGFLDDLAHELAHLVYWEHNLDHLELTSKIMRKFVQWHRKNNVKIKDYYTFDPENL
jgi:hypothetical protein